MALEPQELEMIREIKEEINKVKYILLGNGEVGLCESVRDLNDNHVKNSMRIQSLEVLVTPLDAAQTRKKVLKDLLKTVITVLITLTPVLISMFLYVHKLMAEINKVVPLIQK